MNTVKDKKIWIIGASSGIGAALAKELSLRGARLVISARRYEELEAVSAGLTNPVTIAVLDVSDDKALRNVANIHGPFDSVIFMAAVYNPGLLKDMDIKSARQTIDININGALNTIDAVYSMMRQAQSGQIVLCGSVAAYCGLPNSQPYSLSKAALMNLAESLKIEAELYNIDVKLISPGFVRTPLTDKNDFEMPMIMEPDDAARIIADGLTGKNFEIQLPRKFTRIVKLLSHLPYNIFFMITRDMLRKRMKGGPSGE